MIEENLKNLYRAVLIHNRKIEIIGEILGVTKVACKDTLAGPTWHCYHASYFDLYQNARDNTVEAWEKEYKDMRKERIEWFCPK